MIQYEIYFGSVCIRLVSSQEDVQKYGIITNIPSQKALKNAWLRIQHSGRSDALVTWAHSNTEELFNWLCDLFECRNAAGGVVRNPLGEYLFIYRRQRWDLPKGHVEEGEKIEETAIREVMEECGLPRPVIENKLPVSRHIYREKGKYILKTTYWFLMSSREACELKPQQEEDISKAEWIHPVKIPTLMQNSWSSLIEVIGEALREEQN